MMDALIGVARWLDSGPGWLPVLLDAVIKVTLVLGLATVAVHALTRASAAARHAVLTAAIAGSLALPALLLWLPQWRLPVLPAVATADAGMVAGGVVRHQGAPSSRAHVVAVAPAAGGVQDSTSVRERTERLAWPSMPVALSIAWATVAGALLLRLAIGHSRVRRLAHSSRAGDWVADATSLATEIGVRPAPRFVEGPANAMPMTWGILRPVVMLPSTHTVWPDRRRRMVLLHELAHVARRDCLTQLLANVVCAVYWFNPLSWIAASRLAAERERACDEWVVAAGTDGPEYAEQLLDIARAMRPERLSWSGVSMARRSQLEGRLLAILDPVRGHRPGARLAAGATVAVIAVAVPIVAAVRPTSSAVTPGVPVAAAGFRDSAAAFVLPSEGWVSRPQATEQDREPSDERDGWQQVPAPSPSPQPSPSPMPTPAPRPRATGSAGAGESAAIAEATGEGVSRGTGQASGGSGRGSGGDKGHGRAPADPKVLEALTTALKDPDAEVREQALVALSRLGDARSAAAVAPMLADSSAEIREHAAFALGQMHNPAAVEPLLGALRDTTPGVREQAAFALGQLRDPRAVEPLIAVVGDANAEVRSQACFALAQLRDKRATPKLVAALDDADKEVREHAAFALSQIRDPAAVPALAGKLKDADPEVREQVVFALSQLKAPQAVEPLIQALGDQSDEVQAQAAFALGQIQDRRATAPLIRALKSDSTEVREHAAWALGQLQDPSATDALTAAIKDPDAKVRKAAALALSQVVGQ